MQRRGGLQAAIASGRRERGDGPGPLTALSAARPSPKLLRLMFIVAAAGAAPCRQPEATLPGTLVSVTLTSCLCCRRTSAQGTEPISSRGLRAASTTFEFCLLL